MGVIAWVIPAGSSFRASNPGNGTEEREHSDHGAQLSRSASHAPSLSLFEQLLLAPCTLLDNSLKLPLGEPDLIALQWRYSAR